ncbi:MAG TPA: acyclic terpene utilization AtuA family protein [Pseudonocardia sp.]
MTLRIGNASGFYGDRFSAVREMLTGGPLDVLTGDYLAELTMLILGRAKLKDPTSGYARTFLRQMEESLGLAVDNGVKIVVNAGGVNPAGLADALRGLSDKLGVTARVAHVQGDDLLDRAGALGLGEPLTANAYLGAWGIAECIRSGAQVVVTGRVTDASLVVGPAAAHYGWGRSDYDALAGAVVAGHVVECGPQTTGGNYSFFTEHKLGTPGFPVAEIEADGSSVITKHDGTGGVVTTETVTAQLLYEITGARYAGPDVTTRFDTIAVEQDGPDRVRISGVRGEAPPPTLKVCLNQLGGYRNEMTFVLTGLDIEAKADWVREQLEAGLATRPAELRWTLARTDHPGREGSTEQEASALLHCQARDPDEKVAGRAFSGAVTELALASYPGFHTLTPPGNASAYGIYTAEYVPADQVEHVAVSPDGARSVIPHAGETLELAPVAAPEVPGAPPGGPTRRAPLGAVCGTRSGDKGGDANLGVWARTDDAYRWLAHTLTAERLGQLLPETAPLTVTRHLLPNLRALNFVVSGLLGAGVAEQARFDPQAKALGEWLRSREVDVPEALL